MKLIDVLLLCVVLLLFNGMACAMITPAAKMYRETKNIEYQYERDSFVAAAFKKLCSEAEPARWEQEAALLKTQCTALWAFDSLIFEQQRTVFRAEWCADGKTVMVMVKRGNLL